MARTPACGHARGLELLQQAVANGYFVAPTLASRPQFAPLQDERVFRDLLTASIAGRHEALVAFRNGGGERLLGSGLT